MDTRCVSRWRILTCHAACPPFFASSTDSRCRLSAIPLAFDPSSQPRPLANPPLRLEVSRNLTDTVPELSPFVRSASTRSPLICSFVRLPSNVWSVKSLRISRQICAFKALPFLRCRRLRRRTWWDYLRTQICAPFTQSVSRSCRRTFSLLVVFAVNVPKKRKTTYIPDREVRNFRVV